MSTETSLLGLMHGLLASRVGRIAADIEDLAHLQLDLREQGRG